MKYVLFVIFCYELGMIKIFKGTRSKNLKNLNYTVLEYKIKNYYSQLKKKTLKLYIFFKNLKFKYFQNVIIFKKM